MHVIVDLTKLPRKTGPQGGAKQRHVAEECKQLHSWLRAHATGEWTRVRRSSAPDIVHLTCRKLTADYAQLALQAPVQGSFALSNQQAHLDVQKADADARQMAHEGRAAQCKGAAHTGASVNGECGDRCGAGRVHEQWVGAVNGVYKGVLHRQDVTVWEGR